MIRRTLALALLTLLTACGKAGQPVVPGSGFPHNYPNFNLAPTMPVHDTHPEDQPGMQAGDKAKYTNQGSYIDPSVHDTELQRSTIAPGSTLPYSQTHSSDTADTPLNQGLGLPGQSPSPLPPATSDEATAP